MPSTAQQRGRGIAPAEVTGREVMRTGAGWVALIADAIGGAGRGKILIRTVSLFGSAIGGNEREENGTNGGSLSLVKFSLGRESALRCPWIPQWRDGVPTYAVKS